MYIRTTQSIVVMYGSVFSLQSRIVIFDVESGKKHSEQYLLSDRTMTIISHVLMLDESSLVCSSGKDLHIVPCSVKLKLD